MADLTASVDTDGTGDYLTRQAAETAEQQDLTDGGGDTMTITCEASSGTLDSAPCTINGWTTGAATFLLWKAKVGDEAVKTGFDAARFRAITTTDDCFRQFEDFVRYDGFQLEATGNQCISIGATAGYTRISNCYMQDSADGVVHVDAGSTMDIDIFVCIIDTMSTDGIRYRSDTGTCNIFNCTITGCTDDGVERTGGTLNVINTASFNNGGDDFAGVITTIDFCASDDNTGTNNVAETGGGASWTGDFADAANGDFTLLTGSGLKDAGTDDPGSGLFSNDMDGDPYVSTWSVGADEFVAAGATFNVSVSDGVALGELASGALTIGATVSDGISAGDTPGGALTLTGLVSDGAIFGDVAIGGLQVDVSITDGIVVGDEEIANLVQALTVSDGVSFGDAILTAITFLVSITDGAVFGDVAIDSSALADAPVTLTFSTKAGKVTFTANSPAVAFTASKPEITMTGDN